MSLDTICEVNINIKAKQTWVYVKLGLKYDFKRPTGDKMTNLHNLKNLRLSYLIIFICVALVHMHICVKYGSSMITHGGSTGTKKNGYHLKM